MTVYSTQSSGRDARHALANPHFLPPKRTPPFVDDGHGRTLDIKGSLFCLLPQPRTSALLRFGQPGSRPPRCRYARR